MSEEKEDIEEITDDLEIIDILKVIQTSKEKIWIWQNVGERIVHYAVLKKVDPIKKLVQVHPTAAKGFHVSSRDNVFLYSQSRLVATKLSVREVEKDYIVFSLPKKVMRVTESFVDGLEFVEKENEEAHTHERSHNRQEIEGDKFIKVNFQNEPTVKGEIYFLGDISQSGLSFRIDDPGSFHKGDLLEFSEMNGKALDPTMKGEVMSVRELPELPGMFKVGVRYI
ncbi:MAG: hypothetical protein ACJAT2_000667 [Bacteriovoracaceae bacterium]|jgi:hypothetical protein